MEKRRHFGRRTLLHDVLVGDGKGFRGGIGLLRDRLLRRIGLLCFHDFHEIFHLLNDGLIRDLCLGNLVVGSFRFRR